MRGEQVLIFHSEKDGDDWQNGKLTFRRTKLPFIQRLDTYLWFYWIIIMLEIFHYFVKHLKKSNFSDIFEVFITFINELKMWFYYLVSKLDPLKLLGMYEWKYFATAGQKGVYCVKIPLGSLWITNRTNKRTKNMTRSWLFSPMEERGVTNDPANWLSMFGDYSRCCASTEKLLSNPKDPTPNQARNFAFFRKQVSFFFIQLRSTHYVTKASFNKGEERFRR